MRSYLVLAAVVVLGFAPHSFGQCVSSFGGVTIINNGASTYGIGSVRGIVPTYSIGST